MPSETHNNLKEKYENNLTGFSNKDIKTIYKPKSLDSLKFILYNANLNKENLYVFSTGKNWGLGSKQPVIKNSSILDLSEMNQIIEVNERFKYAIIEPGVTQNDLSSYLKENHPHLKFPVTGSSKGTSITGNILERGPAAFAHRNKLVIAMEVLLANGDVLKTGFWHYFDDNNPLAFHYPHGHGPDIRGLFTQSNLGIVSKLVVRLLPKKNGTLTFIRFDEKHLEIVTDTLRKEYEDKIIDDGVVITNLNDPRTTATGKYDYTGKWLAACSFSGVGQISIYKQRRLRKTLQGIDVKFNFIHTQKNKFSLRKGSFLPYVIQLIKNSSWLFSKLHKKELENGESLGTFIERLEIFKNLYKGEPTNFSIETMAEMNNTVLKNEDLDNSNTLGLNVALPAVPFEGKSAVNVSELVNKVSQKWNVKTFHNLATIDDLCFEGFYRVYFDREDKEASKNAFEWRRDLHFVLQKNGYFPYRMDTEITKEFTSEKDSYWQVVSTIKKALDKNDIISKGKYNV